MTTSEFNAPRGAEATHGTTEASPKGESDDELLDAARAGDPHALERLIERHQAQIYRFGMRMCRDPEDAQDVMQDTLIALARGVRELRGTATLSTWLYTVARSFCIKKRRRKHADPASHTGELEQVSDPARSPEDSAVGKQVEHALEQAIAALEPMYREVLVLRDIEGLSAAEVATVLDITEQAVKSRLHRARVAVRNQIAPLLGVPDTPAKGACPDVLTLFSRYVEGEISAEVCREMEQHLAACPQCRSACDSLKQTLTLCHTANASTEVPAPVQRALREAIATLLRT